MVLLQVTLLPKRKTAGPGVSSVLMNDEYRSIKRELQKDSWETIPKIKERIMRLKPVLALMVIAAAWLVAAPPQAFAGRQVSAALEPETDKLQDEKQRRFFTDL